MPGIKYTRIKELRVGGRVNVVCMTVEKGIPGNPIPLGKQLHGWLVTDASGSTILNVPDVRGGILWPGDVVRIWGAAPYISRRGRLLLNIPRDVDIDLVGRCKSTPNKTSKTQFNPDDFIFFHSADSDYMNYVRTFLYNRRDPELEEDEEDEEDEDDEEDDDE